MRAAAIRYSYMRSTAAILYSYMRITAAMLYSYMRITAAILYSYMRAAAILYPYMLTAAILQASMRAAAILQASMRAAAILHYYMRRNSETAVMNNDGRFKPAFAKRDRKQAMIGIRGIPTNWFKTKLCPSVRLSRLWALYSYVRAAAINSLPGIRQGPSIWRPCALPHQNQQCGDNGRRCPPTGLLLQNKLFKMPGCGAVNP
jgi:hypothetical protein